MSNFFNFTCNNCSHEEHQYHEQYLVWSVIQGIIFGVIITTALIGNIMVCVAVYKFRPLQTTTNYALVSLAITDVLMVYVMLLHAVMVIKGKWTLGIILCDVTSTIGLTLNLVSLVHLTYISFDRYIAITRPFRYQIWITKLRVVLAMIILWVTTCLILNLPWADFKYRSNVFGCLQSVKRGEFRLSTLIMLLAFVSVPTGFILYTHVSICRIARSHAVRLKSQESHLRTSYGQRLNQQPRLTENSLRSSFKRELKSVKTFGIVVGCFLICYMPFYTVATLRSFKGLDSVPSSVLTIVTWFAFSNSCINPVLYSLRNKQFKNGFKKIFRRTIRKIVPLQLQGNNNGRRIWVRTTSVLDELTPSRFETQRNGTCNETACRTS